MANLILIEVRSESKLEKCEDFWFSLAVMSRWIGQLRGDSGIAVECFRMLDGAGNGRSQFNLISPSMERAMGRDAFTRMKASNTLSGSKCHRHGATGGSANCGGGGFTECSGVCVI